MKKTVSFDPNIKIFYMRVWLHASKEARRNNWLQTSADRWRFNERVIKANMELGYIFSKEHREMIRMYTKRSRNNVT